MRIISTWYETAAGMLDMLAFPFDLRRRPFDTFIGSGSLRGMAANARPAEDKIVSDYERARRPERRR